jgi:uncharacterized protein
MFEKSWYQGFGYIGIVFLLFLCACTVSRSAPSRFYILSPLSRQGDQINISGNKGQLNIGIDRVGLPIYLDRPQIVTRQSANEIDLQEFDKWGEPLAEGMLRIVTENLSMLLPSSSYSVSSWEGGRSVDYLVMLKVINFDGDLGGDITLIANWNILGYKRNEMLMSVRSEFIESSGAPEYKAFVEAQSRAVGRLSKQIADGIMSLSR